MRDCVKTIKSVRLQIATRKLSLIEGRGQTAHELNLALTITCDIQFQSMRGCEPCISDPHTHTKDQGQRSVGSKDRVETDGRTDRLTEAIP